MIAVLDYATASAVGPRTALAGLGADVAIVRASEALERASKVVLPDCRSFADALRSLRDGSFLRPLFRLVDESRPVLGIGRGAQFFFDASYEDGLHTGLGLIPGKASRLDPGDHPARAAHPPPHRGWNRVFWNDPRPLLHGLQSGESFFFDHAFHAEPLDASVSVAWCNYGVDFGAVFLRDCLMGTQFRPEDSGPAGLRVLENFLKA